MQRRIHRWVVLGTFYFVASLLHEFRMCLLSCSGSAFGWGVFWLPRVTAAGSREHPAPGQSSHKVYCPNRSRALGKLIFAYEGSIDWSPDRQAEVGDRFGHLEGVQVKALRLIPSSDQRSLGLVFRGGRGHG